MKEAPENGKESSHSAHGNGMNEYLQTSIQNTVVEWLEYSFKLWTIKGQISTRRPVFISVWENYQDKTASFHIPYNSLFTYSPPATENLPNKIRIYNISPSPITTSYSSLLLHQ
jgi:hypothetical protein